MERENDALVFWKRMRTLWLLDFLEELKIRSREMENIISLRIDAYAFWGRNSFALRPIKDEDSRRIYIQMVWLNGLDIEGGLDKGDREYRKLGTTVDLRRSDNLIHVGVRYGDVYLIETDDVEQYPVPSFWVFQLRYSVQKILAGALVAGARANIFSNEPPEDQEYEQGRLLDDVTISSGWDCIFEAAVVQGVLDDAKVEKW